MLERQKKLFGAGGLGSPFGGLGAVSEGDAAKAGGPDASSPSPKATHKRAVTGAFTTTSS